MSSVLPSPSIQISRSLTDLSLEQLGQFSAFDLLCHQCSNNDVLVEAQVDAMKRLPVVAVTMGPQQAASELLPFLQSWIVSNSTQHLPPDEVLLLLGQALVPMISYCGTPLNYLSLTEKLAAVEETVVREQALVVWKALLEHDTTDVTPWLAAVKRLQSADWFTAKVSAAGWVAPLLSVVVKKGNESVTHELLAIFRELAAEDTPMVRRAAAQHLGAVLQAASWQHQEFAATVVPPLASDEQDSVRLLCMASLAAVGSTFGEHPAWTTQHWLPLVKDGATDMSWRVRHNLAKHFADVATNLGIQNDRRHVNEQTLIMSCFVSLLTDAEAEVRAAAVGHLARMIAWGGATHFDQLAPLLPALADDVVMEVRSKCALALMDAAKGGALEDTTILQAFGPLLESFLQDEFHEVQLQVLSNLHKIAHLLPGLSGVVTALLQMTKATNWRVREAVAQLLPHLAEARGLDFFVTVLLEPAWLTLLLDGVASVRISIINGVRLLVQVAGEEWIVTTLLPQHVTIYERNGSSYLMRITILRTYVQAALAAAPAKNALWPEVVRHILHAMQDKVANVRMVAAHGLGAILQETEGSADVVAQIRPVLEQVAQDDDDDDVRRACHAALEHAK